MRSCGHEPMLRGRRASALGAPVRLENAQAGPLAPSVTLHAVAEPPPASSHQPRAVLSFPVAPPPMPAANNPPLAVSTTFAEDVDPSQLSGEFPASILTGASKVCCAPGGNEGQRPV